MTVLTILYLFVNFFVELTLCQLQMLQSGNVYVIIIYFEMAVLHGLEPFHHDCNVDVHVVKCFMPT